VGRREGYRDAGRKSPISLPYSVRSRLIKEREYEGVSLRQKPRKGKRKEGNPPPVENTSHQSHFVKRTGEKEKEQDCHHFPHTGQGGRKKKGENSSLLLETISRQE